MILSLLACLTADLYADQLAEAKCRAQAACRQEWGDDAPDANVCGGGWYSADLYVCRDDYFDPEAAEYCLDHWLTLDCADEADDYGEGYEWCDDVCTNETDTGGN